MAQATLRQIPALIGKRETFKGNSMWASTQSEGAGRLAGTDFAQYMQDWQSMTYVVYSYGTPIAWETEDGKVYQVAQKFSVTTSKHQGAMRYGFSL